MKYLIVNTETGIFFSVKTRHVGCWKTRFGSKGAATRVMNANNLHDTHDVVRGDEYEPRMVERVNLMSGKKYMEDVNTPRFCSPASEAYWSM